jgi:hypothetical protein
VLKEEPSQLKTTHRKVLATFKTKIREYTPVINLFEQSPSLATDYLIPTMNSLWYHILHRPTLQDRRRLKFTKQFIREEDTIQEFTSFYNDIKSECSNKCTFSRQHQPSRS